MPSYNLLLLLLITHSSITFCLGIRNVRILVTVPLCCPCLFTVIVGQTKIHPVHHLDAKYILLPLFCGGRAALPPPNYQVHVPL